MIRSDYEAIRNVMNRFVQDWSNRDTDALAEYIRTDVRFYTSTCLDYTDGGRHSRNGISGFIQEMPETSYLRMDLYNLLVNAQEPQACLTGIICGTAASKGEWKTCQFVFNAAASLEKEDGKWFFTEIRLDLTDFSGDFEEFASCWYMGDPKAHWFAGVHLPMISGELDGVYKKIPRSENVLTDEEQIAEVFYRYAFGIDTVSFQHAEEVFSDELVFNMAPFGIMDKRTTLQAMKLHRGPAKYWTHPALIDSIRIDGDLAEVRIWRMAGHRQRRDPLVLTPENISHRYACARYEIRMCRENEVWKLLKLDYYLGIIPID